MFTQVGGGNQVFLDRLKTQEEIQQFLNQIFKDRQNISLQEFQDICKNEASEMFLAIIILLQNSIPCTENFFRYKNDYKTNSTAGKALTIQTRPKSSGSHEVESPRYLKSLSPLRELSPEFTRFNNQRLDEASPNVVLEDNWVDAKASDNLPQSRNQVKEERKRREEEAAELIALGTDDIEILESVRQK